MGEVTTNLMNTSQVARQLGISKPTLWRLMQNGLIGFYRLGEKKVFFSDKHIADFLADCERKPQRMAA